MLSVACAAKVQELGDKQYTRAVEEYERGIGIAGRSASHTSNGRLRLKLASLQVTWTPFSPLFNAEMQELLQWIFDQDRMPEMKEQASMLLESLSDETRRK
jgi:hypothetical protein